MPSTATNHPRKLNFGGFEALLWSFRSSVETGAKPSVNLCIGPASYSLTIEQAQLLGEAFADAATKALALPPYVARSAA